MWKKAWEKIHYPLVCSSARSACAAKASFKTKKTGTITIKIFVNFTKKPFFYFKEQSPKENSNYNLF